MSRARAIDAAERKREAAREGGEAILGTKTYEDVLFSEEHADRRYPEGSLPGDRQHEISEIVASARQFGSNEPYEVVAGGSGPITPGEHLPFRTVPYWDLQIVRGRLLAHKRGPPQWMYDGYVRQCAYEAAIQSPNYHVELVEADYETGDVTIRVEEVR